MMTFPTPPIENSELSGFEPNKLAMVPEEKNTNTSQPLSEEQKTICEWMVNIDQQAYADLFYAAAVLFNNRSRGYLSLVVHADREIMNGLTRSYAVEGSDNSYLEYAKKIEDIFKCCKKNKIEKISEEGTFYMACDPCQKMNELLKEHSSVNTRKEKAEKIFLNNFLYYNINDIIPENILKILKELKKNFHKYAHLGFIKEKEYKEKEKEIVYYFNLFQNFLYNAARSEYKRLIKIDNIIKISESCPSCDDQIKNIKRFVKADFERQYFFGRLKNHFWLKTLLDNNVFSVPPDAQYLEDERVEWPFWYEFQYLHNIVEKAPDQVVDTILKLPNTNNPRIGYDIVEIALKVSAELSIKLEEKITDYVKGKWHLDAPKIGDLIRYWSQNGQIGSAIELAKICLEFLENINTKKIQTHFDQWGYEEILKKGIDPLIKIEPWEAAKILINTTRNMLSLKYQSEEELKYLRYYSFYERVSELINRNEDIEEMLVHKLYNACEVVFLLKKEKIDNLIDTLKLENWHVFKRIQYHLLSNNLNEQTKPWIREAILSYAGYSQGDYCYEFQKMVRLSCEHFGNDLLSKEELEIILKEICIELSEENSNSIVKKLRPFDRVLFDEYLNFYIKIKNKLNLSEITDEDYPPFISEVKNIVTRSPKNLDELSKLSDSELLKLINTWDDYSLDSNGNEVCVEGLAEIFGSVFDKSIISSTERLDFWIKSISEINRTSYIYKIFNVLSERVKNNNLSHFEKWLKLCDWGLNRANEMVSKDSEENSPPRWSGVQRCIGDFLGKCVENISNVPEQHLMPIFNLLKTLCVAKDWRLDKNRPVFLMQEDLLLEALNNTRSRAIGDLIKFCCILNNKKIDFNKYGNIFQVITKRIDDNNLTPPEIVLLGSNFINLLILSESWSKENKNYIFPKKNFDTWRQSFKYLLINCNYNINIYNLLKEDFNFSIENIKDIALAEENAGEHSLCIRLGWHLFMYYVWNFFEMKGARYSLETYYEGIPANSEFRSILFDYIGRCVSNSENTIEDDIKDKIKSFVDWRLEQGHLAEVVHFSNWLEANCLDSEWRLQRFSKTLDFDSTGIQNIFPPFEKLEELLEQHAELVIECLFKLSKIAQKGCYVYFETESVKHILCVGMESSNEEIKRMTEETLDNLISIGRFAFKNYKETESSLRTGK